MKSIVRIPLATDTAQRARLAALQLAFAKVCNALAPLVQQTRCWNRVALHHMSYRQMRAQFPEMGSQMICNAIYSVSRASRRVYQDPNSPFAIGKQGDAAPLPLLRFQPNSPVFFDRHTLSIKSGQLSMYTLDGRLHFALAVPEDIEQRFRDDKLREVVLKQQGEGFVLDFTFSDGAADTDPVEELPEYVMALDAHQPPEPHSDMNLKP